MVSIGETPTGVDQLGRADDDLSLANLASVATGSALAGLGMTALETAAALEALAGAGDRFARAMHGDFTSPIRCWALDFWEAIKDLDPDDVVSIDAVIDEKFKVLPSSHRQSPPPPNPQSLPPDYAQKRGKPPRVEPKRLDRPRANPGPPPAPPRDTKPSTGQRPGDYDTWSWWRKWWFLAK